jgi:hypothetical protein
MRHIVCLTAIIITGVLLSGCRKKSDADSSPDTPTLLFQRVKAAAARTDWKEFFSNFTAESQRRQLSIYVFDLEQRSQQAGEATHRDFREFLSSRHIEPRVQRQNESGNELKHRFAGVRNLPACLAELIAWTTQHPDLPSKDPLDLREFRKLGTARLIDAALRGDRAILSVRLQEGRVVQFMVRQVGEEWFMDVYRK